MCSEIWGQIRAKYGISIFNQRWPHSAPVYTACPPFSYRINFGYCIDSDKVQTFFACFTKNDLSLAYTVTHVSPYLFHVNAIFQNADLVGKEFVILLFMRVVELFVELQSYLKVKEYLRYGGKFQYKKIDLIILKSKLSV